MKDVQTEPQIKQKEQTPDNTIAVMKTPNKQENEPEVLGEVFCKCRNRVKTCFSMVLKEYVGTYLHCSA